MPGGSDLSNQGTPVARLLIIIVLHFGGDKIPFSSTAWKKGISMYLVEGLEIPVEDWKDMHKVMPHARNRVYLNLYECMSCSTVVPVHPSDTWKCASEKEAAMKSYESFGGDSPMVDYESGDGSSTLGFMDGSVY